MTGVVEPNNVNGNAEHLQREIEALQRQIESYQQNSAAKPSSTDIIASSPSNVSVSPAVATPTMTKATPVAHQWRGFQGQDKRCYNGVIHDPYKKDQNELKAKHQFAKPAWAINRSSATSGGAIRNANSSTTVATVTSSTEEEPKLTFRQAMEAKKKEVEQRKRETMMQGNSHEQGKEKYDKVSEEEYDHDEYDYIEVTTEHEDDGAEILERQEECAGEEVEKEVEIAGVDALQEEIRQMEALIADAQKKKKQNLLSEEEKYGENGGNSLHSEKDANEECYEYDEVVVNDEDDVDGKEQQLAVSPTAPDTSVDAYQKRQRDLRQKHSWSKPSWAAAQEEPDDNDESAILTDSINHGGRLKKPDSGYVSKVKETDQLEFIKGNFIDAQSSSFSSSGALCWLVFFIGQDPNAPQKKEHKKTIEKLHVKPTKAGKIVMHLHGKDAAQLADDFMSLKGKLAKVTSNKKGKQITVQSGDSGTPLHIITSPGNNNYKALDQKAGVYGIIKEGLQVAQQLWEAPSDTEIFVKQAHIYPTKKSKKEFQ